jgi:hypothetical protein
MSDWIGEIRHRILVGGGVGHLYQAEFERLMPNWQPIDTAPVPPREELMHGHWRCMLQTKDGWVCSGYAAYVQGRSRLVKTYTVQWYDDHYRVAAPAYWMPLPLPGRGS